MFILENLTLQKQTEYNFTICPLPISVVDKYKYLGVILNNTLDFNVIANVLADAGCHALTYLTTYSLWSAMHELSLLLNYQVYR